MFKIVDYFLQEKRFTLDHLNELIQSFYYGSEEKNRPSTISHDDIFKNKKIRFSASEVKCFTRYFGVMIGHLVDTAKDGHVWNLYKSLRTYLDILCAPFVSQADAVALKHYCKIVCSEYQNIFGEDLKPKFHLSQHDSDIIDDVGALEPLSCYRMEHKHKEGSDIAHQSHNRVNLPYTVAKHHQMKLAFRLLAGRGFVPKFIYSAIRSIQLENIQYAAYFMSLVPDDHKGVWHTCKWIEVNGAKYALGSVVLHSMNRDIPVFGQVHEIAIRNEKAYLVLQEFEVVKFDEHYHAFEVTRACKWLYVEISDLLSHLATDVRHLVNGKSYITFRFSVKCFSN
jgi:hypothetical protein